MEASSTNVLVIGASGQLGSEILARLEIDNVLTTAFIRPTSTFYLPIKSRILLYKGDLTDFDSVDTACGQNITHVIATASSIVPRKGDAFGADDLLFYKNIIRSCRKNRIKHLIYISAFPSPFDNQVPEFILKRQIEQLIIKSDVPYTIFRGAAFMDVYYAVMGSSTVLQGVEHPTLLRGYWLTRLWASLTGGIIEKYGIALVPGNGKTRQAFICISDVANCMVKSIGNPQLKNKIIDLGGPEAISWKEVAQIYGQLLGRKIRVIPLPLWLLKLLRFLLQRGSPAGANMMSILSLLAHHEFAPDMTDLCQSLQIELTDSKTYLADKLSTD